MKFNRGDIVAFLNATGTGKVVKAEEERVLVLDEHDFENWYPATELIMRKRLEVTHVEKKDDTRAATSRNEFNKPNELTKDLHFGELVQFPKNYTNHEILQIQLSEARKTIDKARRAGIKKVILIHGVGEGRLKEEVHSMLERMDRLAFYDASYHKYGTGATEVELF